MDTSLRWIPKVGLCHSLVPYLILYKASTLLKQAPEIWSLPFFSLSFDSPKNRLLAKMDNLSGPSLSLTPHLTLQNMDILVKWTPKAGPCHSLAPCLTLHNTDSTLKWTPRVGPSLSLTPYLTLQNMDTLVKWTQSKLVLAIL